MLTRNYFSIHYAIIKKLYYSVCLAFSPERFQFNSFLSPGFSSIIFPQNCVWHHAVSLKNEWAVTDASNVWNKIQHDRETNILFRLKLRWNWLTQKPQGKLLGPNSSSDLGHISLETLPTLELVALGLDRSAEESGRKTFSCTQMQGYTSSPLLLQSRIYHPILVSLWTPSAQEGYYLHTHFHCTSQFAKNFCMQFFQLRYRNSEQQIYGLKPCGENVLK